MQQLYYGFFWLTAQSEQGQASLCACAVSRANLCCILCCIQLVPFPRVYWGPYGSTQTITQTSRGSTNL